jgi:ribosomal protein S18 acetylase RimI-like enzyme
VTGGLTLTPCTPAHVDAVARLHTRALPGLLSRLGLRVVRAYYEAALTAPGAIALVLTEHQAVVGFVAGALQPQQLKHNIWTGHGWSLGRALLLSLPTRPRALYWLLRTTLTTEAAPYDTAIPELTYVAVSDRCRGRGAGRQLLVGFGTAIRHAGYDGYALSVEDDNATALGFYRTLGLRPVGSYLEFGRRYHRLYAALPVRDAS